MALSDIGTAAKNISTAAATSTAPKTDWGIKGTFIDDWAIKIFAAIAILVLCSFGFLWFEKAIGAKSLTPFRIWLPTICWLILTIIQKPFLRFGWWGILATLAVIPTTSGYLAQFLQSIAGVR